MSAIFPVSVLNRSTSDWTLNYSTSFFIPEYAPTDEVCSLSLRWKRQASVVGQEHFRTAEIRVVDHLICVKRDDETNIECKINSYRTEKYVHCSIFNFMIFHA